MEHIISTFIDSFVSTFNLQYMFIVNVLTYVIIKTIDELNGRKRVSTWQKRLILIISCVVVSLIYKYYDYVDSIVLINSSIIAPVSWSWIFKPIMEKIGFDYKPNKTKKHEKSI